MLDRGRRPLPGEPDFDRVKLCHCGSSRNPSQAPPSRPDSEKLGGGANCFRVDRPRHCWRYGDISPAIARTAHRPFPETAEPVYDKTVSRPECRIGSTSVIAG